jgi:diketogulonate reductase-like aldo/keto reductase
MLLLQCSKQEENMQITQPMVKAKETSIPALGLGTWMLKDKECEEMVKAALQQGYLHIDTAQAYENEEQVGTGIKSSGFDRDKIFLTTKIAPDSFSPKSLKQSVQDSLKKLKTDYVNLLLLHWPNFENSTMEETLEALVEAKEEGHTLEIGVSNFPVKQLNKAQELTGNTLITNQVEYHPFLDQERVLAAVRQHNMALTAYSPLARGKVMDNPVLVEIAHHHSANPAQIALSWLLSQNQVVAIPKTSTPEHAESNLKAAELVLSGEELERIDGLRSSDGRLIDPDFAPQWD